MGVIISTIVLMCTTIITGVLSSIAADKCGGDGKKWAIGSACVSFLAFLICLAIIIFLL